MRGDTALATTNVRDETKACFMLSGAHNLQHKALKDHLENTFTIGDNKYPLNTTNLLSMMNNCWVSDGKPRARPPTINDNNNNGLNFLQEGDEVEDDEAPTEGVNMLMR